MPKTLTEKTKAIIRLHKFLQYECELGDIDDMSAKELKLLLEAIKRDIISP